MTDNCNPLVFDGKTSVQSITEIEIFVPATLVTVAQKRPCRDGRLYPRLYVHVHDGFWRIQTVQLTYGDEERERSG